VKRITGDIINEAEEKITVARVRRIWPAVMLAANRKDRVIGRRIILVVSISTRNGLSQPGEPSGRRCANEDI
jgi:hypothetical protein